MCWREVLKHSVNVIKVPSGPALAIGSLLISAIISDDLKDAPFSDSTSEMRNRNNPDLIYRKQNIHVIIGLTVTKQREFVKFN